jgi:hypothetical protein
MARWHVAALRRGGDDVRAWDAHALHQPPQPCRVPGVLPDRVGDGRRGGALGCRVWGSEFGDQSLGFRLYVLVFWVLGISLGC